MKGNQKETKKLDLNGISTNMVYYRMQWCCLIHVANLIYWEKLFFFLGVFLPTTLLVHVMKIQHNFLLAVNCLTKSASVILTWDHLCKDFHQREKVGVAPIAEKMEESCLRWFDHVMKRTVEALVKRIDQIEDSLIVRD